MSAMPPELAEVVAAYICAWRQPCAGSPSIGSVVQARAVMQAHMHHVGARCRQRSAAIRYLRDCGKLVLASEYARAG